MAKVSQIELKLFLFRRGKVDCPKRERVFENNGQKARLPILERSVPFDLHFQRAKHRRQNLQIKI